MLFASCLKEIRGKKGFSSARSFYQDYLSKRSKLEFNYSYYMKIEGGRVLPSPAVTQSIAELLLKEEQEALVRAYCRSIFPKHAYLFPASGARPAPAKGSLKQRAPSSDTLLVKPRYLVESQIAQLVKSKHHYYLFLILTLARGPVPLPELRKRLGATQLDGPLSDLQNAKLAHLDGEAASSSVTEMRFPEATSESLKRHYKIIDDWNPEFASEMGFDKPINKMLVRRISSRYKSLLTAQTHIIFDMLRAADEVQDNYNDEVVMLNFTLSHGTLPG